MYSENIIIMKNQKNSWKVIYIYIYIYIYISMSTPSPHTQDIKTIDLYIFFHFSLQ